VYQFRSIWFFFAFFLNKNNTSPLFFVWESVCRKQCCGDKETKINEARKELKDGKAA
jgi:hypothetical protein